jgi:SAM-dependent methyltransferase
MGLFKNSYDSHAHSLEVLELIYGYDSFLDSLTSVADLGCGAGLDAEWWATLETRDDPPEPRNYIVYAVDKDIKQLDTVILAENKNIIPIEGDFEKFGMLPRRVDLIWSHDSLQYSANPIDCIANWKRSLNVNGMLMLTVPQDTYQYNNRMVMTSYSAQPYSFNILNLMYMLAVNGFDCNDAYFYRKENSPWLYAAVYATDQEPLPPTTSWYELSERALINDSLAASVNRFGYARLEDLVVTWLDKNFYKITN